MNFIPKIYLIGISIFILSQLSCLAQNPEHLSVLRQIGDMIEEGATSDEVIIEKIGKELDSRKDGTDISSISNTGSLLGLAGFARYRSNDDPVSVTQVDIENKRRAALEPYAGVPVPADMKGRKLLCLAAGKMGISVDQKGIMAYAKLETKPIGLRVAALDSILGQDHILPELKDDLIELSKNDVHYFDHSTDVGPPTKTVIYPIRNKAAEVLKKLRDDVPGKSNGKGGSATLNPKDSAPAKVAPPVPSDQPVSVSTSQLGSKEHSSARGLVWAGIIAAIYLLWLVLKKR